jgi:hypothetical protein
MGPPPRRFTSFAFEHQALKLPNAVFTLAPVTREAVYKVDIGKTRGVIPLTSLRSTFGITDESEDGQLLTILAKSLRYVKTIRPGDSIPNEILDGTASWPIKDEHRQRAAEKVFGAAIIALAGREALELETEEVEDPTEAAAAKKLIRERAADLASLAGIPDQREAILDRLEQIAQELAYIEALRDWYQEVILLARNLQQLGRRKDRNTEEIGNINKLMQTPLSILKKWTGDIDKETGDVLNMLKNHDRILRLIRRNRDEMHFATMEWSEILPQWRDIDLEHDKLGPQIKNLYRFLAQRFLSTNAWSY